VKLTRLLQAPFTLQSGILERIEREADNARAGRPARIIAKLNGLVSPPVIKALYAASQAGVQIDLIVRGVCCLRPSVTNISENIRVRSILGRFLEHTRVYYFQNDDDPEIYCSSADWMPRNLAQRVEQCFPILGKKNKKRIINDLELYLADNTQAWEMQTDGTYRRITPGDSAPVSAQSVLLKEFSDR